MIGIILLLIALVCYFQKNTRWFSYVLYIGFLSNGYRVLIDKVIGIKNIDLAIFYTFVVGIYLLANGRFTFPRLPMFRWLKVFIFFLVCCVIFSLSYYGYSPYHIAQGERDWLLIFCVPILVRMSHNDFSRTIKMMSYITLITAAIYIAQIIVGRPLLPYHLDHWGFDSSTGFIRLYNVPPFLHFFLALSFVYAKMFRFVWVWRIVFLVALVCTLGRTGIITAILTIFVALWLQGGASRLIKIGVVLMILMIPFADIVADRFEGGNTGSDMQHISSGTYEDYTDTSGGTMTFRLSLLNERIQYLMNRPLSEQFFGMGLVSENSPLVRQRYHFETGLITRSTGYRQQLHSPDIAWANTICTLGFGGTAIYLGFLISMTIFFFRKRKLNPFYLVAAAMSLCGYIETFAGTTVSVFRQIAIYFIVMSTGFVYGTKRITMPNVNEGVSQGEENKYEKNEIEE